MFYLNLRYGMTFETSGGISLLSLGENTTNKEPAHISTQMYKWLLAYCRTGAMPMGNVNLTEVITASRLTVIQLRKH